MKAIRVSKIRYIADALLKDAARYLAERRKMGHLWIYPSYVRCLEADGDLIVVWPDFCSKCHMHDTEHVQERCLLQGTRKRLFDEDAL
jgi:hypothetical protein